MNQIILSGNAVKDFEINRLGNGSIVGKGTIATNEYYKDKKTDERQTHTEFTDFEIWGGQCEWLEKNLKKGFEITVLGKLRTSSWEDEKGNKRSKKFVKAIEVKVHNKNSESSNPKTGSNPTPSAPSGDNNPETGGDDDLPF